MVRPHGETSNANAEILLIECDVPEGETLRDWRRQRDLDRRRTNRRAVRSAMRRALGRR